MSLLFVVVRTTRQELQDVQCSPNPGFVKQCVRQRFIKQRNGERLIEKIVKYSRWFENGILLSLKTDHSITLGKT